MRRVLSLTGVTYAAVLVAVVTSAVVLQQQVTSNRRLVQQVALIRAEASLADRERDVRACARQHATVTLLRLFLHEGTSQFTQRPTTPENDKRLELFARQVAVLLAASDCLNVPPLPQ